MGIVKPILMAMAIANVLNIPICAFFISYLDLGIDGAAISLVLMGVNMVLLCAFYINRSGLVKGR
jgi:Na+-driven multidrug efflux pump